jgi:sugar phosphate isomerase/epimerase
VTVTIAPHAAQGIRFAAHAITWNIPTGDQVGPWLDDVVSAGYDGVGVFGFQMKEFLAQPEVFRAMLDERGLQLASLTGLVDDTPKWAAQQMDFMAHFGAVHFACTDFDTTLTPTRAIAILNERARIGDERGINVYYHNHTGGVGETLTEVEALLDGLDPEHAHVMLDVGHATKDFSELPPTQRALDFLTRHWDRVEFMEFKDWNEQTDLNTPIGEGYADYKGIFKLIAGGGYSGWIIVEQNGNLGPSRGRGPLECATISREFLRGNGL